jgi:diguanylate cyclase (GGDEF)-like protein
VSPDDAVIEPGERFDLADTYCSITVGAPGPVGFENAGASDYALHRAYRVFGSEAYIGTPIHVGGRFFGTLQFSSRRPRERAFAAVDGDSLRLLQSWVSTELQQRDMEQELFETRRHLEHLVRTDPLTELANRRGLGETLQSYSRRSQHARSALSCALLDIDDFKHVNDHYGHSMGDMVIRAVAGGLRESIRPSDIAGRIGGDEFLAILPGANVDQAHGVGERISRRIQALDLRKSGERLPVTVSIGVAAVPVDAYSVTDVLAQTEALLRRSKLSGKNTVSH